MKVLTVEQMRQADRDAIGKADGGGMILMSRAGAAVAMAVETAAALKRTRRVVLIAGHGNNGGDACVAARCLFEDGFNVQVIMTCVPAVLKGDAREAWDEMRTAGVPYLVLASPESWDEDVAVMSGSLLRNGVIVDGVLGTGCQGAPSGAAERSIRWINAMRRRALVVAVDLPSGMHGDTGAVQGEAVRADVTVTFARPKRCFLNQAEAGRVGHLIVADIGITDEQCDRSADASPCQIIALPELAGWLAPRARSAHKGEFGHVCVIGGSAGLPHAPVLAALGALRGGAGLVTLAAPEQSLAAAAAHVPEAMAQALATQDGALSDEALGAWRDDLSCFDAVVAGPGMTAGGQARKIVGRLLADGTGRLVLDADGLNALAALCAEGAFVPRGPQRLLLTPHPGEAARLLGITTDEVQADRVAAVRRLAETYQAVAVLKGAGTLVCEPGGVPWLNLTGNPGMASGGVGDVLAGLAGALWARGLTAFQAACAAVWAHGAAGDFAAFEGGQTALCATDLVRRLPDAFRALERCGL